MTSAKEPDRGFSRAEYRMAQHQCKKASGFLRWKEAKKAGHDLKAAALNREHAAKRVGLELEVEKGIEAGRQQSVLNVAAPRRDSGKFTPKIFRNFLLRIARVVWTFLLTR